MIDSQHGGAESDDFNNSLVFHLGAPVLVHASSTLCTGNGNGTGIGTGTGTGTSIIMQPSLHNTKWNNGLNNSRDRWNPYDTGYILTHGRSLYESCMIGHNCTVISSVCTAV